MASTLIRLCSKSTSTICRRMIAQPRLIRNYAEAAAAPVAQPGQMVFTFAAPDEAYYQESTKVKQVDVPTGTGFIGILASHVPTFGVLKPGVLTVMESEGAVNKYFVSSGTYAINEDSTVQINAEEAVPIDALDKELAKSCLHKAQSELSSASTDIEKAEAQVAIQTYEEILAA
uniref:ATP synthase F(1) complex subunit delta, mitochondrial n=1 Tax=Phallusia mammillata TaxID=59560 RepID=A0A6F9D7Q5_9ASCI|nr:ATP synthase subunit delta, mitochondrial-like [Phallusia mammillata]